MAYTRTILEVLSYTLDGHSISYALANLLLTLRVLAKPRDAFATQTCAFCDAIIAFLLRGGRRVSFSRRAAATTLSRN